MDTREEAFRKLEKGLESNGDSGTIIIPITLMGNISLEEVITYMDRRGYEIPNRNKGVDEIHFHYRLKGAVANA